MCDGRAWKLEARPCRHCTRNHLYYCFSSENSPLLRHFTLESYTLPIMPKKPHIWIRIFLKTSSVEPPNILKHPFDGERATVRLSLIIMGPSPRRGSTTKWGPPQQGRGGGTTIIFLGCSKHFWGDPNIFGGDTNIFWSDPNIFGSDLTIFGGDSSIFASD